MVTAVCRDCLASDSGQHQLCFQQDQARSDDVAEIVRPVALCVASMHGFYSRRFETLRSSILRQSLPAASSSLQTFMQPPVLPSDLTIYGANDDFVFWRLNAFRRSTREESYGNASWRRADVLRRVLRPWRGKKIVLTICHVYRCGCIMPGWADLGRSREMFLFINCEQ